MAYQYKSKAMQEWSGQIQATSNSEYEYKSKAMRDYMANAEKQSQYKSKAMQNYEQNNAKTVQQSENYNEMQRLFAKDVTAPQTSEPFVNNPQNRLKEVEKQIANILAVQGRDKAQREQLNKLVEEQRKLNEQLGNPTKAERLKLSGEALGKTIVASPFAAANMFKQVTTDPVEMEIQALERKADQGVLDKEGWARLKYLKPQQYTKALDTSGKSWQMLKEAQEAQEKASKGLDKAEQFVYNTGMSMATNLATLPANIVAPGASLALMGTQSMANKALDVDENGGSAGEALGRGLASGGIEVLTEAASLGGLVDIVKGKAGKEVVEGAVKNLLKKGKISPLLADAFMQSMTEGGEELVSAIANFAMDKAVGDENAKLTAEDLVLSFLGGAVSGGVMGTGASLLGNNFNNKPNEANRENNDAENTPKRADNIDTLDNNASSEEMKTKVAENAALTAENGTKSSDLKDYNAENAQLSEKQENFAKDINVLNKQPEIATETAVSKQPANLLNNEENGQKRPVALAQERYGEQGKRAFAKVQNDAQKAAEFDAIYRAGQAGQMLPTAEGLLTKAEKGEAFMAGVADAKTNREAYAAKQIVTNKNAGLDNATAGHIALKNRQTLDRLGKALGVRISFADNIEGNGQYRMNTGEIVINKNVGNAYKVITSHEVIHRLRQTAPEEFYAFAKAVMEYNKPNSKDVAEYDALYGLNEGNIDYYDMLEEMVADFVSGEVDAQALADMLAKEPTLAEKFIAVIKDFLQKLNVIKEPEVKAVKDEWENILKLLENTVQAGQKFTAEATNPAGDVLTIKDNETGETRYNLWSYRNGGRKVLTDTLEKQKFPAVEVKRAADLMDEMAVMMENFARDYASVLDWNNTEVLYDQHGKTYYSAMVKNGDYKINIDLSTICKKRIALQNVLNRLVKQNLINDVSLSPENIATINRILKENGYETQCPACFVESKRYNIEKWANDFADKWNGVLAEAGFTPNGSFDFSHGRNDDHMDAAAMLADDLSKADAMLANIGTPKRDENGNILYKKNGRPQMYQANSKQRIVKLLRDNPQLRKTFTAQDLIGTEGIRNIKTQYPEIYSLILTNWGVATPKIVQTTVPYNNEVAVYKDIAKKSKYIGGVRMFSFSDFTIDQVFDYVQVVADLYAQKAMMHTYTKEIAFAKLFGTTGIKINLSYIPAIDKSVGKENAGLNAKGELIYSEWGVQPDEAEALMKDRRYSPNITPIMIGVSDNHIRKLLDTNSIRFIIPYHKSSLNPVVAKMTDIENYKDYSDEQTTRHKDGTSLSKAENSKFDFYKTLEKTKDARKTADAYLEWCDKNGYLPKFEQFRGHENYYKLLVDFNLYDAVTGEFVPQKAVTMTFPEEFSQIVGEELAKQKGLSDKLGIKDDQVFEQIVGAIKKDKSGDVRYSKKRDAEYMDAYWDGDDDRMQELVDEAAYRAGYKYKAYHHTENGFTIFDLDKARKNMDIQGFYFFADAEEGDEYGSVTYDTYLKMENPYIVDSREKQNAIPFDMSKDNTGVTAREWLQEQGYDSVIRKAEYFGAGADEYIVFDSAQIKSAEAMTFEDDEYGEGDIIPLSERFNKDNNDIRWSKKVDKNSDTDYNEEKGGAENETLFDENRLWRRENSFARQAENNGRNIRKTSEHSNESRDKQGQSGTFALEDSEGNKIPRSIAEKLKDTAVSIKGKPILMYHFSTNMDFDTFNKGDTGFHFGSFSQAKKRQKDKNSTGRFIKVYLNIKNPVRINELNGFFPVSLATHLYGKNILSDKELQAVFDAHFNGKALKEDDVYNSISAQTLRYILAEKGIDGFVYENGYEGEGDSYMALYPEQVIIVDDGKGENSTRESRKSTPTIPDGYKERGYNESLHEKTDLPEEVKQEFIDFPEIYKQLANKVTSTKAAQILARGVDVAEAEFKRLLDKMDAVAIPLGYNLAKQYIDNGQQDRAVEILRDMSRQLTKAGQFSQAAAITLMRADPVTALRYVEREIDKLNADGKKTFGKKWKDFELTAEEKDMFANIKQGDEEAIKAAYEKINKRIAKEYPSTIWQKFVEASRIAMLLNPRTNAKNIVSNMLLRPVTRASGKVSAAMQKAYGYFDKTYSPTQAFLVKKETKKLAEEIWNNIKDTLETANKYDEGIKGYKRDMQVFKEGIGTRMMENIAPGTLHKLNKLMGKEDAGVAETLRNATYYFLELGDNRYVRKNFIDRLGSYLQAQDITSLDNVDQDVIDAAVQVAYKEALRATFKDDTALSSWLASIKHTNSPVINAMMEMIMPFTKTPANIAMRGIDYSPVGLLNTIVKAYKGRMSKEEMFDELGKNSLGTALIAFGMWLFGKGLVTGGEPENEKQAAFLKQQGWQAYAVKTPNGNYVTYDWAQPAAIPIIMGVTIAESLEEGRLGVVDAVKNAGVASFNQWIELSPLQSLQEVMGGYDSVGENLLNTAIEMPQRLIPSALGATARTADTTQRVTYSKGDVMQTQKDLAKSKVPGLSQTLPAAYDTWGREKKRDNSTLGAAFSQYVNPSTYKKSKSTEVDAEIDRLYEAVGDSAVYPRKASYSIERGGKKYTLSNKEYSEYQRIMGELSYDGVKALMAKPAYSSLTDLEKAEIIKDIYDNAFEKAKFAIMEGQGYEKTSEDIRTAKETKIKQVYMEATPENIAEYYIAYYISNNTDGDKATNGKTIAGSVKKNSINRLVELGFTRSQAKRLYEAMN